jgi:putative membrane protein
MSKAGEAITLPDPRLRECLAIERTIMANERTFLSYVRSALGLFIGGVSFIEFFESATMQVVGWVFIPLGIIAFTLGLIRYKRIRDLIRDAEKVCHFEAETFSAGNPERNVG